MNEISCRTTNAFIQYVQQTRPEFLRSLLEGLPHTEKYLMDPDNWISWDVERIMEERLVSLYDDEMIMFKIGKSVVSQKSLGIVNILSNLFMTPERFIRYTPRIVRYFTRDVLQVSVLDAGPQRATLEFRVKGKQTRGACLYNQGMLSVSLELFGLKSADVHELQCSVPIHEAGRIQGKSYSIDDKKRVIENSIPGKQGTVVGHLSDNRTFPLGKTTYGAESCIYRLEWENRRRGLFKKTAGTREALSDAMKHLEENHEKLEAAYERLWHSEAKYRNLMENASDIICTLDTQGVITSINKKGVELSGFSSDELLGQNFLFFVHEGYKKEAHERLIRSLESSEGPFELAIRTKGSDPLVISASSSIIRESGNTVGLMIIARDITKDLEISARLLEAERFAAKGMIAAEIAHEINNSLANMETALFIVNNIRTDTQYRKDIFHDIVEEIGRMSGIVKGILEVYRADNTVIEPVDINAEITKVINITRRRLYGNVISVAVDLCPDLPAVPCYRGHIKQIMLNLIKNAEESMSTSRKKLITISTSEENGCVRMDVKDTGCGIPRKNQGKVFSPLYTSKAEGSGIGLSICREIISKYNGDITVQSNEGEGTTISVSLPTRYHVQHTRS